MKSYAGKGVYTVLEQRVIHPFDHLMFYTFHQLRYIE